MDALPYALTGIASYFGIIFLNKLIRNEEYTIQEIKNSTDLTPLTVLKQIINDKQAGKLRINPENINEYISKRCVSGIVVCDHPLRSKLNVDKELVLSKYYRDSIKLTLALTERTRSKKNKVFLNAVPFEIKDPSNNMSCKIDCNIDVDISKYLEKIGEKRHYKLLNFREQLSSWLLFTRIGWIENELGISVGTKLFAFGDIIYDIAKNTIRMQNPSYLVRDKAILIIKLNMGLIRKNILKILLSGCFVFCGTMVLQRIYRHFKDKINKNKNQKVNILRQLARDVKSDDDLFCIICVEKQRNVITLPCYHMCICYDCYSQLNPKKCPVCKHGVIEIMEIFVNQQV